VRASVLEMGLGGVIIGRVDRNARNEVLERAQCPVIIIVYPFAHAGIFPRKRNVHGYTRPLKQFRFLILALSDYVVMYVCLQVSSCISVFITILITGELNWIYLLNC
jgi:hypothetical protein